MALSFGKRENESQPTPVRPLGAAPAASPVQPLGAHAASQAAQAASHPVKIDNCGVTLQFEQAPKSAVTIGQAGTEMLYALGVGDKVVGTAHIAEYIFLILCQIFSSRA